MGFIFLKKMMIVCYLALQKFILIIVFKKIKTSPYGRDEV